MKAEVNLLCTHWLLEHTIYQCDTKLYCYWHLVHLVQVISEWTFITHLLEVFFSLSISNVSFILFWCFHQKLNQVRCGWLPCGCMHVLTKNCSFLWPIISHPVHLNSDSNSIYGSQIGAWTPTQKRKLSWVQHLVRLYWQPNVNNGDCHWLLSGTVLTV